MIKTGATYRSRFIDFNVAMSPLVVQILFEAGC